MQWVVGSHELDHVLLPGGQQRWIRLPKPHLGHRPSAVPAFASQALSNGPGMLTSRGLDPAEDGGVSLEVVLRLHLAHARLSAHG